MGHGERFSPRDLSPKGEFVMAWGFEKEEELLFKDPTSPSYPL